MIRLSGLSIIFCLCFTAFASCKNAPTHSEKDQQHLRAKRIVSLDFCADQYVLKFVEPNRILALSPDAEKPFSYMRKTAKGLKTVRASAENILVLKPDLIVRSHGGGPKAEAFFKAAGIPVLNVGWAGDMDGIKTVTRQMAKGLGAEDLGEAVITDIETKLAGLDSPNEKTLGLYMTPSGVTSGAGSLVDELMKLAGLTNFQNQPGWRSLPLERLAYERPEMVAAAFFDSISHQKDAWSAMRHPVAKAQINSLPTVYLNGSWMSCGAWFAVEAVQALSERRYARPQTQSAGEADK